MTSGKNIYFLSDFHLGAPDYESSLKREKIIVQFLDEIKAGAEQIYIMGDMFDFWFEYKSVVPKGYVRLFGKIAELTDSGIPVHFFVGNHDMWMHDYFQKELGVQVYHHPEEKMLLGKNFYLAHGDGLGPGDHKYKFLKKVFRNKISQSLFGFLHPYVGIGLANYFSTKSREAAGPEEEVFLGEDKEWLIIFCKHMLKQRHFNYFIFGHRHLPMDIKLTESSHYINLGDWITHFSYAVFDGEALELKYYKQ